MQYVKLIDLLQDLVARATVHPGLLMAAFAALLAGELVLALAARVLLVLILVLPAIFVLGHASLISPTIPASDVGALIAAAVFLLGVLLGLVPSVRSASAVLTLWFAFALTARPVAAALEWPPAIVIALALGGRQIWKPVPWIVLSSSLACMAMEVHSPIRSIATIILIAGLGVIFENLPGRSEQSASSVAGRQSVPVSFSPLLAATRKRHAELNA